MMPYCSPFIWVTNASNRTFLSESVPDKRGTKWSGGVFTPFDQTRAVKHPDHTRINLLIVIVKLKNEKDALYGQATYSASKCWFLCPKYVKIHQCALVIYTFFQGLYRDPRPEPEYHKS